LLKLLIPLRLSAAGLSLALFVFAPFASQSQAFTMYGAEFTFDGYFAEVNVNDASLTTITEHTGHFYAGMDFQPTTGVLWAVSGTILYTIDPTTGSALTAHTITGAPRIFNISFAPNGLLYGLDNGNLYLIDPQTATATFIGFADLTIAGIEFGPGGVLYGCGGDLFQIDPNTGAALDLGRLVSGVVAYFVDMDFAPNGMLYGVTYNSTTNSLYRINPSTATASVIGATDNLKSIASVPEPGSVGLIALGAAGLLFWTRRATAYSR
jgi:hypothetical protein